MVSFIRSMYHHIIHTPHSPPPPESQRLRTKPKIIPTFRHTLNLYLTTQRALERRTTYPNEERQSLRDLETAQQDQKQNDTLTKIEFGCPVDFNKIQKNNARFKDATLNALKIKYNTQIWEASTNLPEPQVGYAGEEKIFLCNLVRDELKEDTRAYGSE